MLVFSLFAPLVKSTKGIMDVPKGWKLLITEGILIKFRYLNRALYCSFKYLAC